ncbi:hypothetical protein KU43P_33730 [Pseudomonas sp. KU43P]|nr:hypothetical protein KU43P_33730 [Pseudomonas sp. KU43P]
MTTGSTVTCPHCMNAVPWGASVCRGCQAEISYGTPRGVAVFFLIVCVVAGWWAAKGVHTFITTNSTVLWIVFGAVFLATGYGARKVCKSYYHGRTNFRRYYRK